MMHFVPTGANTAQSKSKLPFKKAHADTFGFTLETQSRFIVMFACGMNQHHRAIGHARSMWHMPAVK
eukprot:12527654-Ditylum_brightwellii.AAC.1